jgi:hypothetical protein
MGLDSTGVVYGENDKWGLGTYDMLEYDRDIYKNIIYPLLWHTEAFGKG